MMIHGKVPECDFTGRVYETPVWGAHLLAQGATGRWCPVMYMGPEYMKETEEEVITASEAERKIIEELGGYPDF